MFIIPHHPIDNRKNNILVLCERPTYGINRCFGGIKKSFCIMVAWGYIIMVITAICLLIEKNR